MAISWEMYVHEKVKLSWVGHVCLYHDYEIYEVTIRCQPMKTSLSWQFHGKERPTYEITTMSISLNQEIMVFSCSNHVDFIEK